MGVLGYKVGDSSSEHLDTVFDTPSSSWERISPQNMKLQVVFMSNASCQPTTFVPCRQGFAARHRGMQGVMLLAPCAWSAIAMLVTSALHSSSWAGGACTASLSTNETKAFTCCALSEHLICSEPWKPPAHWLAAWILPLPLLSSFEECIEPGVKTWNCMCLLTLWWELQHLNSWESVAGHSHKTFPHLFHDSGGKVKFKWYFPI